MLDISRSVMLIFDVKTTAHKAMFNVIRVLL